MFAAVINLQKKVYYADKTIISLVSRIKQTPCSNVVTSFVVVIAFAAPAAVVDMILATVGQQIL